MPSNPVDAGIERSATPGFPMLLGLVNDLPYEYRDGDGFDFEPYGQFLDAVETQRWVRAWTHNPIATGDQFLFFGQDGSGGLTGIWKASTHTDLLDQPIVFLGSEGETRVISKNFSDYLWLLASGHSGVETEYLNDEKAPEEAFVKFAEQHATTPRRKPSAIIAEAHDLYPSFQDYISGLCGEP
ncbi:hypothetical protein [Pseudomonas amygdali]|nr:hypothetical protein [Pseudomonas amygdali]RMT05851.1 hypothetical protein ALP54_03753 [Pseudomonas amygdali pv. lachrymans]